METFVGLALLTCAAMLAARTVQVAIGGRAVHRDRRTSNTRQALRLRPTHRYPRR
jgi:hypothetical protein